jgi:hypothetical protein
LIGLNLADGTTKYQITLPFSESFFVGAGQGLDVDPLSGDVFVFGRENQTGPHTLLRQETIFLTSQCRIFPSVSEYKTIATFEGIDVLGGVAAYDPIHKIFWVESASNTSILYFGIDVHEGDIKFTVNADEFNLETLVWDPATKLMFGLGLAGNDTFAYRTIVSLDSKTGELSLVGKKLN